MRVHADWSAAGFGLEPVAPATGPFARREFLEVWWRHRGSGELLLVESDDALVPLHRVGATVGFLGEGDLTDYHSPLGGGATRVLAEFTAELAPGTRLVFDSLPREAADVVEAGLEGAGLRPQRVRHQVAAVADLPASHDEYLLGLDKKQRHEVRRKRRRYEEAVGDVDLVRATGRFGEFVAMHRSSRGDKAAFMSAGMEKLFADLLGIPGAVLDLLVAPDGAAVAAAFSFEDRDGYYLYNSAFDADAGHASPGVVLVDALIEAAIGAGRRRFDFLKGDEAYKFRLGARERPLYRLEALR